MNLYFKPLSLSVFFKHCSLLGKISPATPWHCRFRAYISVLIRILVLVEDSAGATGPGDFIRAVGAVAKVVVSKLAKLVVLEDGA